MNPLAIAPSVARLASGCIQLYTWIKHTVEVEEDVSGLCNEVSALSRALDLVSSAATLAPWVVITDIDLRESLGCGRGHARRYQYYPR